GGAFANMNYGSFINTHTWAKWDETGVPQFYRTPFSTSASYGGNVTFTAVPDTGYTSWTLQWYKDGNALSDGPTGYGSTISGAHAENLNIQSVTGWDQGSYWCVITNS